MVCAKSFADKAKRGLYYGMLPGNQIACNACGVFFAEETKRRRDAPDRATNATHINPGRASAVKVGGSCATGCIACNSIRYDACIRSGMQACQVKTRKFDREQNEKEEKGGRGAREWGSGDDDEAPPLVGWTFLNLDTIALWMCSGEEKGVHAHEVLSLLGGGGARRAAKCRGATAGAATTIRATAAKECRTERGSRITRCGRGEEAKHTPRALGLLFESHAVDFKDCFED